MIHRKQDQKNLFYILTDLPHNYLGGLDWRTHLIWDRNYYIWKGLPFYFYSPIKTVCQISHSRKKQWIKMEWTNKFSLNWHIFSFEYSSSLKYITLTRIQSYSSKSVSSKYLFIQLLFIQFMKLFSMP